MDRREFVVGTASLTLAQLLGSTGFSAAAASSSFVDVHCHLFNLDDLPAEGFIDRTVLQPRILDLAKTRPWLADILREHPQAILVVLKAIADLVRAKAPSPQEEIEYLKKEQWRSVGARERAERELLRDILQLFWHPGLLAAQVKEVDGRATTRALINIAAEYARYGLKAELLPHVEMGDTDGIEYDPEEYKVIAERLYDSERQIGVLARWALAFSARRYELTDQLAANHGNTSDLLMIVPLLIDFSMWLHDPEDLTKKKKGLPAPIAAQVDVMSHVSRRKNGPRVHGFVAYDPLYEAMTRAHPKKFEATPLKTVIDAVENKGFIGVKVYPPMGFRPANNVALKTTDFPPRIVDQKAGLGVGTGAKLDTALNDLYAYCAKNNVPIMAHCANSNASAPRYGYRAHPIHWGVALRQPGLENLRVCLAHMGTFYGHQLVGSWEWAVGEIWKANREIQLYVDLSDLTELLPAIDPDNNPVAAAQQKAKREFCRKRLKEFKTLFPISVDRLMFGSDWTMLGREEGFPTRTFNSSPKITYANLMIEFLRDAEFTEEERTKVMSKNAIKFLGLDGKSKPIGNRGRLEKFYATSGLPTDLLNKFDIKDEI